MTGREVFRAADAAGHRDHARRRELAGARVRRRRRHAACSWRPARGPYLSDVDGNEYVDLVGSWGPMILGHAHPEVIAAVRDAAGRGTSFGAVTPGEVELAAELDRRAPRCRTSGWSTPAPRPR